MLRGTGKQRQHKGPVLRGRTLCREGRASRRLLQGQGREYDEDGLLIYKGNFVDGVRSGAGSCYEGGVLVYEGEFANGLYEGMGSLYEDGALAYRGNFAAGLQEGDGTAYYPSGERAYTGSFAQGLYEGEGTAYRENGDVLYRGSFAQGLYDGSGTLYAGYLMGTTSSAGIIREETGLSRVDACAVFDGSLYLIGSQDGGAQGK